MSSYDTFSLTNYSSNFFNKISGLCMKEKFETVLFMYFFYVQNIVYTVKTYYYFLWYIRAYRIKNCFLFIIYTLHFSFLLPKTAALWHP